MQKIKISLKHKKKLFLIYTPLQWENAAFQIGSHFWFHLKGSGSIPDLGCWCIPPLHSSRTWQCMCACVYIIHYGAFKRTNLHGLYFLFEKKTVSLVIYLVKYLAQEHCKMWIKKLQSSSLPNFIPVCPL